MKAKVYFYPIAGKPSPEELGNAAVKLFQAGSGDKNWTSAKASAGDFIAVKIHFGEKGNQGHIKAETAGVLCRHLKKKARPFLTDTNTLYRGERDNAWNHLMIASEHGFSIENCGVPVIISDGLRGQSQVEVEVKGEAQFVKKTFIASDISLCDGIVGLSHMTGHLLTGFGSTIKNLGMGCAGRGGKLNQHSDVKPAVKKETCVKCGQCLKWCPANAISLSDKAVIDKNKCYGCGECFAVCPVGAIKHSWQQSSDGLQKRMAEHALAALTGREAKSSYFNFLTHFTKDCDCMGGSEEPLIKDIGILFSTDPVAVDRAAFDLVEAQEGSGFIKKLWPENDSCIQMQHAEKLGLGTQEYELVKV
ncbi:MAG: DUF362 domain-containing protein [Candidatus Wallbacteria bacterium]|nr:DUF362 domain-containing protein [Candidatus Wallbacteria bacterium]